MDWTKKDDTAHEHCWHIFTGPFMMVLRDDEVLQKCCKCAATRTIHGGHA